ncbi:MAG: hypothetical protein HUU57_16670, partial [Bdellovibrio sp.]|nr:hypothetical protein [Bdellovibrio sp.]
DLDSHGRFSAKSSHAYKNGYLERPIVDEWLDILRQIICKNWPMLIVVEHQFSIKVSHDVDTPSMYGFKSWPMIARMMVSHLIKRRDMRSFFVAPYIRATSGSELSFRDKYNTFDWLMDQSEVRGLTSAFYFICGRTDKTKDADYELEHPAIRDLLRRIHERGHEIGLHPSYGSYKNSAILSSEARHLISVCREEGIVQQSWGGRMHYLRWEQPTTLNAWADAGMAYDSTLGYADHPGFRCGTCFEYPAYDPVEQCSVNLRVRPLIVMEGSVISSSYLGLGTSVLAYDKIATLKDRCRKVNGCFTLLWHNSYLDGENLKNLYIRSISDSTRQH